MFIAAQLFFWKRLKRRFTFGIFGTITIIVLIFFANCLPSNLFAMPTATVVQDRSGQLLSAHIADDGQWRFPHNDSVPYKFKTCLIQFEDRAFESHPGVHLPSMIRAISQNVKAGKVVSGGSTISMQVIRMSRGNPPRTIWEKLTEMCRAGRLETRYSKAEILAFYSSNAPMGGNVVGVDAAAWRYFGRSAYDLTWAESATLAVLPNAPSLIYPGKNQIRLKEKRNRLLQRLFEIGEIDESTLAVSIVEPLPQKPHPLPQKAPHATQFLVKSFGKGKVHTSTIDSKIQTRAAEIVDVHAQRLSQNGVNHAAVLVLDVHTNEVLAYIGNSSASSNKDGCHVDIMQSRRSTGSILKPFLFAAMLDEGSILPTMLVPDVPTNFGGYSPKNYERRYDGAVPASLALSRSLNVPAVTMLSRFGVARFQDILAKIGLSTFDRPASNYGLSLILGGGEATLYEVASAYAGMARTILDFHDDNGRYNSSTFHTPYILYQGGEMHTGEVPSTLSAASCYQTFEALLSVNRPQNELGWEDYSSSHKIAWKTGTSFGARDAWAIGVTPDYVVAVWVGNADGEGRPGISGVSAAAPILFDISDVLPYSAWFPVPHDELVPVAICRESGHRMGQFCDAADTLLIPKSGLRSQPCPYHKLVFLNSSGTHRVHAGCADEQKMKKESWFELPPVQEWYYAQNHPQYRTALSYDPQCVGTDAEQALDLIYPRSSGKVIIPRGIDGSYSRAVLQATHRQPNAHLHWHLNNTYLGSTSGIHQLEIIPQMGKYTLTVVDDDGNYVTREIEIVMSK
jgi:penicillin-binding protein 1C